jgi:hypothetical protein
LYDQGPFLFFSRNVKGLGSREQWELREKIRRKPIRIIAFLKQKYEVVEHLVSVDSSKYSLLSSGFVVKLRLLSQGKKRAQHAAPLGMFL